MPPTILSRNWSIVPRLRKVAIARRRRLASSGENLAATIASFIACSWNKGTPLVLASTPTSSSYGPCCGERSEEHTSELQSLMRISYAVFCLKKKKKEPENRHHNRTTKTNNAIRKTRHKPKQD